MTERNTNLKSIDNFHIDQLDFVTDIQDLTVVFAHSDGSPLSMEIHYPDRTEASDNGDHLPYYSLGWTTAISGEKAVEIFRDFGNRFDANDYTCFSDRTPNIPAISISINSNEADKSEEFSGEGDDLEKLIGSNVRFLRADTDNCSLVWNQKDMFSGKPDIGVIADIPIDSGYVPELVTETMGEEDKLAAQVALGSLQRIFRIYGIRRPNSFIPESSAYTKAAEA